MMIKKILLFLIFSLSIFALKSPDIDMDISVKAERRFIEIDRR